MTRHEMKLEHEKTAQMWDKELRAIADPVAQNEMLWLALRTERVLIDIYLGTMMHQDNQIELTQAIIRSKADCLDRHGIARPDLPLEPVVAH